MPMPKTGLSISTGVVIDELRVTLVQIDKQIKHIKDDVMATWFPPGHVVPDPEFVYTLKYGNGHYLLTDLLVARAQTLSAIANLQASYKR